METTFTIYPMGEDPHTYVYDFNKPNFVLVDGEREICNSHRLQYLLTRDLTKDYMPNSQKVKRAKPPKGTLNRYFCTWTRNPKMGSKQQWFEQLMGQLRRDIHTFVSGVIEHIDSNIHCHCTLESKNNLGVDRYVTFFRDHPGCGTSKRIQKAEWDNGMNRYMEKENEPFTSLDEFYEYYKNKIN